MEAELLILTTFALVAACFLWRFLPVGTLHGRTIRLHEWHRWRRNLRWEKINRLLAEARDLPAAERLRPLARLALKYSGEPLWKGDEVVEEIGALGTEESLPFILNLLRDTAPISAKPLMRGIQTACRRGTTSPRWKQGLFDEPASRLNEAEWMERNGFYETLLALDGPKAMERLCHPEVMSIRKPNFMGLIHAINLSENIIPQKLVGRLLIQNDELAESEWNSRRTLALIEAWAHHDKDDARKRLWVLIRAGGREALEAAECLLGVEELPHPRYAIDARVSRMGLAAVSPAEQVVWVVDSCYLYPLSFNPFYVFFEEDYADRFDEIVSALRAIGAIGRAEWLEGAGALLGPEGPGKTAAERSSQMDKMQPSAGEVFEAYAAAWSGVLENVDLLNLIYILEHAAEFPRGLSVFGELRE